MQLYTHRLGADLLAAGLTKLTVSCDGLSQETYARYRVGGDLQRVKTGVQHLLALKAARRAVYPLIEVQFIVFRHNEHEMEAFARYWRDVGVDRVSFIRMSFMSRAGRRRAEQLGMVPTNDQWTPHFPYGKVRECRDLYRHVSVNWDGGIYTCCFPSGEDVYALGNIVTGNLRRVWNGPRYRYARRLVAHRRCDGRWYETMCHDCVGIYPSPAATRYWFEPAARPDQKAA
jgi:radical SAM protein with 4Fe4S-binding SPASM domain